MWGRESGSRPAVVIVVAHLALFHFNATLSLSFAILKCHCAPLCCINVFKTISIYTKLA